VRRNLLLIGLEALHNTARHARATRVTIGFAPVRRRWMYWIADNGVGADAARIRETIGLGLASMRRRAEQIGAELVWDSTPGGGVTVTVVFDPRHE